MRIVRNLAFTGLVALAVLLAGVPSQGYTTGTSAPSRGLCQDPPLNERCDYLYHFVECGEWPSTCWLGYEYEEWEANEVCDDFADHCEISADAFLDGAECY